ncbi:hypothetical protein BJY52DRAFT_374960 [Lactarius psammicola]|nr:hypothetical protein BJY52DRAFT_374960 [Lactarius psammicola]
MGNGPGLTGHTTYKLLLSLTSYRHLFLCHQARPCKQFRARMKTPHLANLPRAPTPLRSVNFRHTTPGSGVVLITKYKPQHTSELFDPSYPGAHLSLDRRHALAPRYVSKHFNLYAFPKAFLSKPDAPYPLPYVPRPYPARHRRPEQRSVDMSMIKEAVRLIVTRGAAVEESRGATQRIVFRPEDVGAEKWIVPDWTYIALPTTEMFRMPFTEQLSLMRKALESIHRRIQDVEKILRSGGRQAPHSPEIVHQPSWPQSITIQKKLYQQGKNGKSILRQPRTCADKVVSRDDGHRMTEGSRDYDRLAKVTRTGRA